ncbi:MAG: T9SS C-terminal target domain-containing protein [Chitinophagia bacterium]|nr:T9SS C-terminal target domain-containing protein [Chitinophagia bacterium]
MKKLSSLTYLLTLCLLSVGMSVSARTAPAITRQPVNDTVCTGATARFIVATDDTAASFVWEVSRDGGTWDTIRTGTAPYTGATNDTLWAVTADSMGGYLYRVSASNDSGTTVSNIVTLVVNPLPVAGTLSGSHSICITAPTSLVSTIAGGTWRTSDTAIATIGSTTGLVTPVRVGSVTLTYRVSNSCGIADSMFMVHIDSAYMHEMLSVPGAVCAGATVRATAMHAGGNWSMTNGNASVSSTGVITGISSGMDTVYHISTNGCGSDTAWASITVDTVISAGTISGPANVCAGSSISFTATHPGGTWLTSNATMAVVDASGNVTGRAAGAVTISYFFVNSCGIALATATATVAVPASTIGGPDSVGIGASIMLTNTATGGTWSHADTNITLNATTGAVTGVLSGTSVVTYTVTNICGTSSATKLIYVDNAPAVADILGPDSICAGRSAAYFDSTGGGTWSVTNANASVNARGIVTGIVDESYDTLNYTYTNAFGTTVISKVIKIAAAPPVVSVSGPASFLLAVPYTLVANPAGGTWRSLGTNVVFTTATNFVILAKGITPLVYTYTNACGTTRDTFIVNLPADSVNAVSQITGATEQLSVFPNPTTGEVMVSLNSSYNEAVSIEVSSVTGQLISTTKGTTNTVNKVNLNVPAGVYFIKSATMHGTLVTRVTVE